MAKSTWTEFLEGKKKIIVIIFPDSMNNSNSLIDMLLATIYNYRSANKGSRLSLIIDEIENKNLEKNSPINKFMKESARYGISMVLASQSYSSKDVRLFRVISNAGIKVFFSPQDDSIDDIASVLNRKGPYIEKLWELEQGECIVKARFYSKSKGKNKLQILYGKTPDFTETPYYTKDKQPFTYTKPRSMAPSKIGSLNKTDTEQDTSQEEERAKQILDRFKFE